jgi:hypothetical protein
MNLSIDSNSTKLLDPECTHYFKHYEEHFSSFRQRPIKILEIGVKDGDSLQIWKDYFHEESEIYGIEINQEPLKDFKLERTKIFFGSQTDMVFLNKVLGEMGKVDIIIDDGGHTQDQLITSFNFLFEHALKDGGVYVMEDLGCSYWWKWSGGLINPNSIINFLKQKIDGLNYRFWKGDRQDYIPIPNVKNVDATFQDENIFSLTFSKGMCFIKKNNNKTGE